MKGMRMSPENEKQQALGNSLLSKDALDQDLKAADGYVVYSAELLRLALLEMTGIAALLLKMSEKLGAPIHQSACEFGPTCLVLLICAGCCLWHRYVAVDSMALHIEYLRQKAESLTGTDLPTGREPRHLNRIEEAKQRRDSRFHLAEWLLKISAIALLAGVALAILPVVNALSYIAKAETSKTAS